MEVDDLDTGLQDRHAVVTGASGGIGLEVTRVFLEEGTRVTATYRTSERRLADLQEKWPEALALRGVDVRKESETERLFLDANEHFGRVDILVTNAGIANYEGKAVHEMSLEQWDDTLAVNLTGSFLCAKYFFANLERHPGKSASLILIGSTAGFFGEAWYCDYSTSKAGLHGLMLSLKNEIVHLSRKGRVNLVNPGWTVTPMAEDALKDYGMVRRILQTVPMRKVASPKDIANTILYLASDRLSGHVSGQTINVAGGMEGRVLFTQDEIDPSLSRG
ncbi:MAG: SDR family NAD(P)-dependent oxidoreductase [Candidatus Thorarchaeota archaeon]|jgi:NAD(P)-dependent dehydrogenase (short-subunit alcohol dehydrogenase family)